MGSWFAAFEAKRTNPDQSVYWLPKPSEEFYRIEGDPDELRNIVTGSAHADRCESLRRALRAEIIATRDTGFIPEGMFSRLSGEKTIYDYAQSPAYPIERIVDLADRATSRDVKFLPELRTALEDAHPVIRYWGAMGCLILQQKAAPAKAQLQATLRDDWADVRIVAAEALGYHGEGEAAFTALTSVIRTGQPYEVLAALNTLEYVWRAGHVSLDRVQAAVRDLKLAEPADRIPRFLLSLK
jgi:hypothetical protein